MEKLQIETERKFLIRYPDKAILERQEGCVKKEIEQTYLLCDTGSLRVRKTVQDKEAFYHINKKTKTLSFSHEEYEKEISQEVYTELLLCRDTSRQTISKERYAIPNGRHTLEIDIYPFWSDRAILEIELQNENEQYCIPQYITVIREVTDDKRYSNKSLALQIFTENIDLK